MYQSFGCSVNFVREMIDRNIGVNMGHHMIPIPECINKYMMYSFQVVMLPGGDYCLIAFCINRRKMAEFLQNNLLLRV